MDHRSHVGLVDAHPERVRGDDHVGVALHEAVLGGGALVGGHAGVVADRLQALGAQPLADLLDVPARAAVDDRGPVRGVRERRRQAASACAPSIPCPRAGPRRTTGSAGRSPSARRTGPAGRGARGSPPPPARSRSRCRPSPSGTRAGRSRRAGAGSRGGSRDPTPTRSAPRRRRTGRPCASASADRNEAEAKRSGEQKTIRAAPAAHRVQRASTTALSSIPEAIIAAGWPPSRSLRYWSAISAISGETTTVRSGGGDPGELVAEALAAAGRHHDEAVAAVERGLHRLALPGPELAVAEVLEQRVGIARPLVRSSAAARRRRSGRGPSARAAPRGRPSRRRAPWPRRPPRRGRGRRAPATGPVAPRARDPAAGRGRPRCARPAPGPWLRSRPSRSA